MFIAVVQCGCRCYVTANSDEFNHYLSDTNIPTELEGKPFHYVQQYCPMSLQVQCNCKVVLSSSATTYIYIYIYDLHILYIQYNTIHTYVYYLQKHYDRISYPNAYHGGCNKNMSICIGLLMIHHG